MVSEKAWAVLPVNKESSAGLNHHKSGVCDRAPLMCIYLSPCKIMQRIFWTAVDPNHCIGSGVLYSLHHAFTQFFTRWSKVVILLILDTHYDCFLFTVSSFLFVSIHFQMWVANFFLLMTIIMCAASFKCRAGAVDAWPISMPMPRCELYTS